MDYLITPSTLCGRLQLPPSKSLSHRRIFMAMLSKTKMVLNDVLDCDDIRATLACFESLGAVYSWQQGDLCIDSRSLFQTTGQPLNAGASASTLRFLIPICLTQLDRCCFQMDRQLERRSLSVYEKLLASQVQFLKEEQTLTVSGKLSAGIYRVDGSQSSQYISGLLMALPLLDGDSVLEISSEAVSKDYIAMTLACLEASGIDIQKKAATVFEIKGRQHYHFKDVGSQPDASASAFFEVARYLGHPLDIPLVNDRYQADAKIHDLLKKLPEGDVSVDVRDMPDLVPALSLAMALSPHHYEMTHAKRLKDKESNRLQATADVLKAMGAVIEVKEDGFMIEGVKQLRGACVSSCHDHRIAMMAAVGASLAKGTTVLYDGQCVSKSWPQFFEVYRQLGGKIDELPLRK